jgi:CheY-like chemotaxis protein
LGAKILLVDDEVVLRESVGELLVALGYEVIQAVDGLDALEKFKANREEIGLVLMDLTMPRMDGREAFLAIRAIDPRVRVILSSGYTEQDATSRLIGSGLAAFLQKPYRLKDLEEILKKVLGSSKS